MTRPANQNSLDALIRNLVRQEIKGIFSFAQENTSQNNSFLAAKEPSRPVRRRRGSRRITKSIKGRVTKSTDKRLKANRAATE